VHKAELYIRIIQIIADISETHVFVSVECRRRLRLLPLSAFVTGVGSRKTVIQKEKDIIEAHALSPKCFMLWNRCTCHIAFDFVGKKNKIIVSRNVTFMTQCTKEDPGARLVNPWIIGKKRTFTVLGTFFLCPTIFFPVFFLGFVNGKNWWYTNFSYVTQMYEVKGVITFMITREMH
jgi:hypothetical protein